jgi:hypothetical protein
MAMHARIDTEQSPLFCPLDRSDCFGVLLSASPLRETAIKSIGRSRQLDRFGRTPVLVRTLLLRSFRTLCLAQSL